MSDWQQIIKDQSIASLEKLAEKFGHDVIDVEALKPAFDNFQMRITAAWFPQRFRQCAPENELEDRCRANL